MQILYNSCCGIDVHARTVVACLITDGNKEVRTFSTMTDDLLALKVVHKIKTKNYLCLKWTFLLSL